MTSSFIFTLICVVFVVGVSLGACIAAIVRVSGKDDDISVLLRCSVAVVDKLPENPGYAAQLIYLLQSGDTYTPYIYVIDHYKELENSDDWKHLAEKVQLWMS